MLVQRATMGPPVTSKAIRWWRYIEGLKPHHKQLVVLDEKVKIVCSVISQVIRPLREIQITITQPTEAILLQSELEASQPRADNVNNSNKIQWNSRRELARIPLDATNLVALRKSSVAHLPLQQMSNSLKRPKSCQASISRKIRCLH